ncbi:hypothetical protein ERO13_D05G317500v2 [Gossypium hirsutum]|nr:hypothetical protein ERO13_D05G317500v2 [Gossypium hirsutum]
MAGGRRQATTGRCQTSMVKCGGGVQGVGAAHRGKGVHAALERARVCSPLPKLLMLFGLGFLIFWARWVYLILVLGRNCNGLFYFGIWGSILDPGKNGLLQ